jgi:hypothetical protein
MPRWHPAASRFGLTQFSKDGARRNEPFRLARDPVHQHLDAVLRQQEGGEREPGELLVAVRVGGPVEVDRGSIGQDADRVPCDFYKPREFLGGFAAVAHEHQEGTELLGFDLTGQDETHRVACLLPRQGPREPWPAGEGPDIGREGMSVRPVRGGDSRFFHVATPS